MAGNGNGNGVETTRLAPPPQGMRTWWLIIITNSMLFSTVWLCIFLGASLAEVGTLVVPLAGAFNLPVGGWLFGKYGAGKTDVASLKAQQSTTVTHTQEADGKVTVKTETAPPATGG